LLTTLLCRFLAIRADYEHVDIFNKMGQITFGHCQVYFQTMIQVHAHAKVNSWLHDWAHACLNLIRQVSMVLSPL